MWQIRFKGKTPQNKLFQQEEYIEESETDHVADTASRGSPFKNLCQLIWKLCTLMVIPCRFFSRQCSSYGPNGQPLVKILSSNLVATYLRGDPLQNIFGQYDSYRPNGNPLQKLCQPMCKIHPLGVPLAKYVSSNMVDMSPRGDPLKHLCQPMCQIGS